MVQGDNKFEMLINMSTLCDDTWINITYTQHIFIHLATYILNGREIKDRVCVCTTGVECLLGDYHR